MRWILACLLLASLAGCQAPTIADELTAFGAIDAALADAPKLRPIYAQADPAPGEPVGTASFWRVGLQAADGHAYEAHVYAPGARQDLGFGDAKEHPDGAVIRHDLGPSVPVVVLTTRGSADSDKMGPATSYWLDGQQGGRWRLENAAGAAWFNSAGTPIDTPGVPPTAWEALAQLQQAGLAPADPALTAVQGRESRGGFQQGAAHEPIFMLAPDSPFDGRAQFWHFTWQEGGGIGAAVWANGQLLPTEGEGGSQLPPLVRIIDSNDAVQHMTGQQATPVAYHLSGGSRPAWSAQWTVGDVVEGPSVSASRYALLAVTGHVFEQGPAGRPVCDALPPHLSVEPSTQQVTLWGDGPDSFPDETRFAAWENWRIQEENATGCGRMDRFTGASSALRMGWPGPAGHFTAAWEGNRLLVDGLPMEPGDVRGVQIDDVQTHDTTDGPAQYTYTGTLTLTHMGWWPAAGVTIQQDPVE